MNYIVNSLAAYEVHVARYYYRRGAYIAAANRAQQAVQEFQYSPSAEEALVILTRSYERLGLAELRDDAQRVLEKNFPNSPSPPTSAARPTSPGGSSGELVALKGALRLGARQLGASRQVSSQAVASASLATRVIGGSARAGAGRSSSRPCAGRTPPAGRGRFRCGSGARRPA